MSGIQQIIDSFMLNSVAVPVTPIEFFAQRFALYQQNRAQIESRITAAELRLEETKKICARDAWKFTALRGSKVKREDPRITDATQAIQALFSALSALDESAKEIIDFVSEQKAFEAKREAEDAAEDAADAPIEDGEPWTSLPPYKHRHVIEEEEESWYPYSSSLTERYMRNLGEMTLVTMRLDRVSAASWNWNTPIGQKSFLQRCQERIKH